MAYTFRLASAVILSMLVGGCGGDDTTNPIVVDSSTPVDALADTAVLDSSAIADASDAAKVDATPPDNPGPGPTQQCPFVKDQDGFFTLMSPKSDYVVRLPPTYDEQNPKPTRLLVSLHGCGDTAQNHATWAAVPYSMRATQDYIAISVGGRDNTCWTVPGDAALVFAAITHVRSCFYVHQKKIVLAGYSSGGDLTYLTSLKNASMFAGILILHSDISQNVGANNVDATLAGASWKLNTAINAGTQDAVYPIATVRGDRDKMIAKGFPVKYQETNETHNATSDDWSLFLIPQMANWLAP